MIYKNFRRIIKPFYIKKFNNKILKNRLKRDDFNDIEVIIPDEREKYITNGDKIKHIGLRILRILCHISDRHNLKVALSYGTLLGAIRHQGFIPWDDDIDVFMTQTDFDKFLRLAHLLPENILFTTMDVGFFKLMDKSSIVSRDQKRGVAVDIFILKEKKGKLSFFNVHTLKNYYIDKSEYYPIEDHSFENFQFGVPSNFDKLLKGIYGNYMKLPPEEQQVSHHSDAEGIRINSYGKFLVDNNDVL